MEISDNNYIILKKVNQNNLKNISLKIPKNKLTVITGVSGSGKSTLAFDVINAEGQRLFFANLSAQARKYFSKLRKPDAEQIYNLPPTLSIAQYSLNNSPRSTVGTLTGIYDYLRLLFARTGKPDKKIDIKINKSLFSFNTEYGACKNCKGLGVEDKISQDLIIDDINKSIKQQALKITKPDGYTIYSQVTLDSLNKVCNAHNFDVNTPLKELTQEQLNVLFYGSNKIKIPYGKHTLESRMKWKGITVKPREEGFYKGIIPVMEEILKRDRNPNILRFAKTQTCSVCNGNRLNKNALSVKVNGFNIADLSNMNLSELKIFIEQSIKKQQNNKLIYSILNESLKYINSLIDLGLQYLTLNRNAETLSPGEIQRIRLSKLIHSKLQNVCFVFDEPSSGVYPEENITIIKYLKKLVKNGNTVIVVEHDKQTILNADYIVDIGPKSGKDGGKLIFEGALQKFLKDNTIYSLTKDYLNEKSKVEIPNNNNSKSDFFQIKDAEINNLNKINVSFKKNAINVLCGKSGAGKKSLINQTLIPLLQNTYFKQLNAKGKPKLENADFDKIIIVNRQGIGKTSRSTLATYTKLHNLLRNLFTSLPQAKEQGLTGSHFSFNSKLGACEHCGGIGKIETGMHFLGNIENVCPVCNGKRYKNNILSVKYNNYNISEILDKTVDEAANIFKNEKKIHKILSLLQELGLGYLTLGQTSSTLSGGESQRIKLVSEWLKSKEKNNLFILDEPTSGLHFYDIQTQLNWFNNIKNKQNTIVAIEYNEDFIKNADHIVELGFEDESKLANVLFQGTYKDLIKSETSHISKYLNNKVFFIDDAKINKTHKISFYGVKTHNLKNINVQIPINKHTVITGKSGSGKSSLAFDTIYAHSLNSFLESFPAYLRQYTTVKSDADIDYAEAYTPAIALKQTNTISSNRSNLALLTDLHYYYRLLFSRFGEKFCPECNNPMPKDSQICNKCGNQTIATNIAHNFSFNQGEGFCTVCKGVGLTLSSNEQLLVKDASKSIFDGAFINHKYLKFLSEKDGQFVAILLAVGKKYGYDFTKSINELSEEAKNIMFYGCNNELFEVEWNFKRKNRKGTHKFTSQWKGFANLVVEEYHKKHANGKGDELIDLIEEIPCKHCNGSQYNKDILSVKIQNNSIADLLSADVKTNLDFFKKTDSSKYDKQLIEIIIQKLTALSDFGLSYLQLNRKSKSLSGGELQRSLLSLHLNNYMSGVSFILDEPSKGLHFYDIKNLIKNINKIVNNNNTIISVEHNNLIINNAHHLIEIGPDAGQNGGDIVYNGTPDFVNDKFKKYENILENLEVYHNANPEKIIIKSAKANNLKNIDVAFLKNNLNLVTGISGSGKTSLVYDVLYKSFKAEKAVNCFHISGLSDFDNIIMLKQINKKSGKNTDILSFIDEKNQIPKFWASTPEAKKMNLKAQDFNPKSKQSSCPDCKGKGYIKVELDFLNDIKHICETCAGTGLKENVYSLKFDNYTYSDFTNMSIYSAIDFLSKANISISTLNLMKELGLSYLKLNQKINTLSGGELQSLNVIKSISHHQKKEGKTLFVFDEPSAGIGIENIEYLLKMFNMLLQKNNTIIVIEHLPQIIKKAAHIVDLGHKTGDFGGDLIIQGKVKDVKNCKESLTGLFL